MVVQDVAASSNVTTNESDGAADVLGAGVTAAVAAENVPAPHSNGEQLARDLGITPGDKCSAGAEATNMGCSLGCSCDWHQQCYPKYIYIDDGTHTGADWSSKRFDVGACEPGMPILIVSSVGLFIGALLVVVTGRMLLLGQFAARDSVDAAAMNLPPAPYMKPPMVVVPASGVAAQAQIAAASSADTPRVSKGKTATAADSAQVYTDAPPSPPVTPSAHRSSTSS